MSGTDAGANFGAFIARVGSFTADGNGHITTALEDVTDAGSLPQLVQFTGGSYSIQSNGRGTLTLLSSTGGLQMSIALNSGNAGVMIQNRPERSFEWLVHPANASCFHANSYRGTVRV